ncbi:MAG TPA: hypothetical protein VGF56_04885 [Rhizomicrobium sp.]|jgi:hypothetical protein
MRRATRSVLALSMLLASAAGAQAPFVGAWFTEGTENHHHFLVVIANKPDHTFEKHFRYFDTCVDQRRSAETGAWKLTGARYFEQTLTVNGHSTSMADPYYRGTFDIGRMDGGLVVMTDEVTHLTWRLQRVADDFKVPDGGCTS